MFFITWKWIILKNCGKHLKITIICLRRKWKWFEISIRLQYPQENWFLHNTVLREKKQFVFRQHIHEDIFILKCAKFAGILIQILIIYFFSKGKWFFRPCWYTRPARRIHRMETLFVGRSVDERKVLNWVSLKSNCDYSFETSDFTRGILRLSSSKMSWCFHRHNKNIFQKKKVLSRYSRCYNLGEIVVGKQLIYNSKCNTFVELRKMLKYARFPSLPYSSLKNSCKHD